VIEGSQLSALKRCSTQVLAPFPLSQQLLSLVQQTVKRSVSMTVQFRGTAAIAILTRCYTRGPIAFVAI
jgi:hypothetical protein